MLAPEPFFEPRGTPFSEFHRIKALGALGHSIDLVTYPIGRDVDLPNLRIIRSLRPPFVRSVRIGPSAVKVVLDALMLLTIARVALTGRYDAIHSHEEMGLVGVWLAKLLRIPHLYDMHSSLPQQLSNFKFSGSTALRKIFDVAEGQMVGKSDVVITICQELQDTVTAMGHGARSLLIENVMGGDVEEPPTLTPATIRERWGLPADAPIVLYTGTFEAYQGLDLLFAAMAIVKRSRPDARLVLAGGKPPQVAQATAQAAAAGIGDVTLFTGERPATEIPAYLLASDVLVSPRSRGTNTPLKIYQYLRSGRAIVATRLLTHTQVLADDTSILTAATAEGFAGGILAALNDPEMAARIGRNAQQLAETKYSYEAYLEKTRQACAALGLPSAPVSSAGVGVEAGVKAQAKDLA